MAKSTFLLILFVNISFSLYSQKEDQHWLLGYEYFHREGDTIAGNTSINFNYEPVKIYHETKHRINMDGGNASLCDKDGNLILCSNGQVLINGQNEFIEDTINYDYQIHPDCNEWEYNNLGNQDTAIVAGLLLHQRILLLPVHQKIFAVYNTYTYCVEKHIYRVVFSSLEINEQNPFGEIKLKDLIVYSQDTLLSSLHAIRHGNGRDWWVVTFTNGFEYIITFLVTETGVVFHQKVKTGYTKRADGTVGQIVFSPNGNYLALYTGNKFNSLTGGGFCLWDFDRCAGMPRNLRQVISDRPSLDMGVAFSQDSKYLYVSNGSHIKQYDPKSPKFKLDEKIVAVFDSFYYEVPGPNPNNLKFYVSFSQLKLGADGRIYIFPHSGGNQYLSVINFPHEEALKVGVHQHGIYTPRIFTRTVPNIPEFRLGPDDGSPCDTLGLDNHPIAKFRYEPDSSNYKKIRFTDLSYFRPETWSWDFGDGSPTLSDRYPFHTYDQNGTYQVCLTVSNENSSHTTCRTVTIGTSSSDDAGQKADITLFPNPVADVLLVTLGEYIPQHGMIHIHDATGRVILSHRLYYGHNNLDMTSLTPGLYFWTAEDKGVKIKQGKVVKM
jgi:hypothetical protein